MPTTDTANNDTQARTLWEKVQTYTIVTVIAALIWLYSESENVKLQKPLQFNIRFVAPPGQPLYIVPTATQQVLITASCATSQYAQLQRLQAKPIHLTVTDDPANSQQTVVLREKLIDSPIGDLGVNLVDIQPRTLDLRVERLQQVTLPISTDSIVPPGIQMSTPPVVNPAEAVVSLPASIAARVRDVKFEAHVDPEATAQLNENVPHDLTVPLSLPPWINDQLRAAPPTITPPTATVTITIRKQTDSVKLSGVPILLAAPWSEIRRFNVELEGNQRVLREELQLAGPSDVIDSIRKGETRVWAELRLSAEELETRIASKQLFINVPSGVQVESTIPRASFTITPASVQPAPTLTPTITPAPPAPSSP